MYYLLSKSRCILMQIVVDRDSFAPRCNRFIEPSNFSISLIPTSRDPKGRPEENL
jgi:hypothetical protein